MSPIALFPIGQVDSTHIVDFPDEDRESRSSNPRGDFEVVAARVPTPGVSGNFMAPVNDVCLLISCGSGSGSGGESDLG